MNVVGVHRRELPPLTAREHPVPPTIDTDQDMYIARVVDHGPRWWLETVVLRHLGLRGCALGIAGVTGDVDQGTVRNQPAAR